MFTYVYISLQICLRDKILSQTQARQRATRRLIRIRRFRWADCPLEWDHHQPRRSERAVLVGEQNKKLFCWGGVFWLKPPTNHLPRTAWSFLNVPTRKWLQIRCITAVLVRFQNGRKVSRPTSYVWAFEKFFWISECHKCLPGVSGIFGWLFGAYLVYHTGTL